MNTHFVALILILSVFGLSSYAQTVESKKYPIKVTQSTSPVGQIQYRPLGQRRNILKTSMSQSTTKNSFFQRTSLGYYHQFLGPTLGNGTNGVTYNVFQEGINSPGSGFAPYQSFHVANLRHELNPDWALGGTLSVVNGYTDSVQNTDSSGQFFSNNGETQFFNARAYLSLPKWSQGLGTLYTTLSYEFPTSTISKQDEMRWGWVVAQSYAFTLPSVRWNMGLMGQIYRIYYKNNVKKPPFPGGLPTSLQTMIISGGPYLSYRFSDKWMLGTILTFDWDQRGNQSGTTDFNNNLSNRGRVTLNYYPQKIKFLQCVGIFSQALLKYSPETTAVGADFSLKF